MAVLWWVDRFPHKESSSEEGLPTGVPFTKHLLGTLQTLCHLIIAKNLSKLVHNFQKK